MSKVGSPLHYVMAKLTSAVFNGLTFRSLVTVYANNSEAPLFLCKVLRISKEECSDLSNPISILPDDGSHTIRNMLE